MRISREEILGVLRGSEWPETFEDIYDSLWEEPDPVELHCVLNEMVEKGLLEKGVDEDERVVYGARREAD